MFIARDKELATLEQHYSSGTFECVIVYGRRRVGKTTLINKFLENKQSVFFAALESSEEKNKEGLSLSIAASRNNSSDEPLDSAPIFRNISDAFTSVFQQAKEERLVFVIDEYPYLASADQSASSVLQHAIDTYKDTSKLMIILCGSSMSFMENQVLGYQSPLYGRRTAQIKVEPFSYNQSRLFHKNFSPEDSAIVYGITGGIPQYLEKINDNLSLRDNIEQNILNPSSYLFEETSNLLKQELREPAHYNNIIQSIAVGASRLNEISTSTHLDTALCSFYLKNLIELGIIEKEYPFNEKNSRRSTYRIKDSFFRFWYKFIPPMMSLIQSGRTDIATDLIMKRMGDYMGQTFEEISKEWLWSQNGESLPFIMIDAGRWWGGDPQTKKQVEIDIVATGEGKTEGLLAECKWTNSPLNENTIQKLQDKARLFPFKQAHLYLFSKAGFTESCLRETQSNKNLHLVSLVDMQREHVSLNEND